MYLNAYFLRLLFSHLTSVSVMQLTSGWSLLFALQRSDGVLAAQARQWIQRSSSKMGHQTFDCDVLAFAPKKYTLDLGRVSGDILLFSWRKKCGIYYFSTPYDFFVLFVLLISFDHIVRRSVNATFCLTPHSATMRIRVRCAPTP